MNRNSLRRNVVVPSVLTFALLLVVLQLMRKKGRISNAALAVKGGWKMGPVQVVIGESLVQPCLQGYRNAAHTPYLIEDVTD